MNGRKEVVALLNKGLGLAACLIEMIGEEEKSKEKHGSR